MAYKNHSPKYVDRVIAKVLSEYITDKPEELAKALRQRLPRDGDGNIPPNKVNEQVVRHKLDAMIRNNDLSVWKAEAPEKKDLFAENYTMSPGEEALVREKQRLKAGLKNQTGFYSDEEFKQIQRRLEKAKWLT